MFARVFEEMEQLRRSMDRLFERNFPATSRWGTSESTSDWAFSVPVETGWTDDHLNLRAILPGVSEKDFSLTVQGNQLHIRGERKRPADFGKEDSVWYTLPYGKFERVLDLPTGLNFEKLEAHLHDGVLDVHIPLAEAVKPKRIEIQVGEERKKLAAA